ncbi:MAG: hypothetical protein Q9227_005718 [Pyrenula ochraceoflavens]
MSSTAPIAAAPAPFHVDPTRRDVAPLLLDSEPLLETLMDAGKYTFSGLEDLSEGALASIDRLEAQNYAKTQQSIRNLVASFDVPTRITDKYNENQSGALQIPQETEVGFHAQDGFPEVNGNARQTPQNTEEPPTDILKMGEYQDPESFEEEEEYGSTSGESAPQSLVQSHLKGRIEAYAKFDFPDGTFYMTTPRVVMGRDIVALRAAAVEEGKQWSALQNGASASSDRARSSHGSFSNDGLRGAPSAASASGGICVLDEDKLREAADQSPPATVDPRNTQVRKCQVSDTTTAFVIQESRSHSLPSHMPVDDDSLPLVPIHPAVQDDCGAVDIEGHGSISRMHLQIEWNDEKGTFEAKCLGMNGFFFNGVFHPGGTTCELGDSATIQIRGIQFRWRTPNVFNTPTESDDDLENGEATGDEDDDEIVESVEVAQDHAPARRGQKSRKARESKQVADVLVKSVEHENVVKPKRGPGRPPKGEKSVRQMREEQKLENARRAKENNGGVTPPPSMIRKIGARPPKDDPVAEPKKEKRPYKKRARLDDAGISPADGNDSKRNGTLFQDPPPEKRMRISESPEYPSKEDFTPAQLERPTKNYKNLLYDMFLEDPTPKPLRLIYRFFKQKWPHFIFEPSNGWQSSIRHNLGGARELFEPIDKAGKGRIWSLKPGAVLTDDSKKKKVDLPAKPAMNPAARYQGPPPTYPPHSYPPNMPYPLQGPNGPYPIPPNGQTPSQTNQMNGATPQPGPNAPPPSNIPPQAPNINQQNNNQPNSRPPQQNNFRPPSYPATHYPRPPPSSSSANGHTNSRPPVPSPNPAPTQQQQQPPPPPPRNPAHHHPPPPPLHTPQTTQSQPQPPPPPPSQSSNPRAEVLNYTHRFRALMLTDAMYPARIIRLVDAASAVILDGREYIIDKYSVTSDKKDFEAVLVPLREFAANVGWKAKRVEEGETNTNVNPPETQGSGSGEGEDGPGNRQESTAETSTARVEEEGGDEQGQEQEEPTQAPTSQD